jgi:hypothetical protein
MGRPQTKARLLAFFDKRIGQVVTLDELQREFPDLTSDQLRVGVGNLRNSPSNESGGFDMKTSLQVVARGNAWTWRPVQALTATSPQESQKRCFEEVGQTRDGSMIIQADDGTLWKAVEL